MSQSDLARKCRVDRKDIGSYEHARRFPEAERLDRLAEALGVDVSDLFKHPDTPSSPDITELVAFIEDASRRDPTFPARALRLLQALLP